MTQTMTQDTKTDFHEFRQELARFKRVLITTHVRPDGDALSTAAAMHIGLAHQGIDSQVLLLSHLPRKYAFIFEDFDVPYVEAETDWPADFSLENFDACLVVDTGAWSQLPGLKERFENWTVPKLVLDHHLTQEDWPSRHLVITSAAAAAEVAADLLLEWKVPLDRPLATALFLGLASDTGWFQFSNTRPHTLRLAARLMEAGVDTDWMYQHLYQNERAERITLQTRAMQSLELLAHGRLAVMRATRHDFIDIGAHVNDTENVVNIPLQISTVEVSILLTEPIDFGPIRISLRSKGHVNVAEFAQQFGGGGHARAAGIKIDGNLAMAHNQVTTAMERYLASVAIAPPPLKLNTAGA